MITQRLDVLIGGPMHGKTVTVQGRPTATEILHPSADEFSLGVERSPYELITVRFSRTRRVEFYSHSKLPATQANEMLWDHLMGLARARPC